MKKFKTILICSLFCFVSTFLLSACSGGNSSSGSKSIKGLNRDIFIENDNGVGIFEKGKSIKYFHKEPIAVGYGDSLIHHLNSDYVVLDNIDRKVGIFIVYDRNDNYKKVYEGSNISKYLQVECSDNCSESDIYTRDVEELFAQLKEDYGITHESDSAHYHFGNYGVEDWFVYKSVMYALTFKLKDDGKCEYFTAEISKGTKEDSINWNRIATVKSLEQQDDEIDDYGEEEVYVLPAYPFKGCGWKFGRNNDEFIVDRWSNSTGQHYDIYEGDKKVDEIPDARSSWNVVG